MSLEAYMFLVWCSKFPSEIITHRSCRVIELKGSVLTRLGSYGCWDSQTVLVPLKTAAQSELVSCPRSSEMARGQQSLVTNPQQRHTPRLN